MDNINNPKYQILNWRPNSGNLPIYNPEIEEVLVQFEDGTIGHSMLPENYNWDIKNIHAVKKYTVVPKGFRSCNPNLNPVPSYFTKHNCPTCNLDLNQIMGYVCPRMDCPCFVKAIC